ncbi:dUTPase [Sea otter poxvirus]|uniref:Deoxyuridine 5'-triphosphate nucleotidohydrolase n=1 Tax=Sea otter poxvirus TaxID=1416741 RepID=A0A2U9QHL4_9POXV|nr:dUTPase [Sea otter poxvirus]AWU47076.1 dUTPase [Sea otter poxvirus]
MACERNHRLKVSLLSQTAKIPTRGTPQSAGYDLYSAHSYIIPSGGKCVVYTDLQIGVPDGCYGRIAPRSGLATKYFIDVGAGVIDSDYRGNVGIVLFNFGKNPFKIHVGDRVAQLICECIKIPQVEVVQAMQQSLRDTNGFGSTGIR